MRRSGPSYALARCCAAAAVLAMGANVSCSATSRVGQARVTEAGGLPCFAIPDEPETRRGGMRLFALTVSETVSGSWKSLPAQLWGFAADPPGTALQSSSRTCVRYGDAPAQAKVTQSAAPLQPGRVYAVEIDARPATDSSPTRGYKAEFCVKREGDGATRVHTVPWDELAKRWRYEVCTGELKGP